MQVVVIYFNMSKKEEDLKRMRQEEYSGKLSTALLIVIADLSFIEISNLITFCSIMKEKLNYVTLVYQEL